MKKIHLIILTLLLSTLSNQVNGQKLLSVDPESANRFSTEIGIDPGTFFSLGYERKFLIPSSGRPIVIYTNYGTSVADIKDSEYKIGLYVPVLQKAAFKVFTNINLSSGSLSTRTFDSRKFATSKKIAAGFYKPKWFFAITSEHEKIILTHLSHSEIFRNVYYEDAIDGWYKGSGGMHQYGIETGLSIGNNWDLSLEIKMPFTENFNSYGGSPLHLNLNLGYRY